MEAKTAIFPKHIIDFALEHPKHFQVFVISVVFVPLLFTFYLFQWNFYIIMLFALGYLSGVTGYYFYGKTANGMDAFNSFRKHHRLIAENLHDMVIIQRLKDGKNEYVNSAATSILGYAQGELIGQPTVFIIHPEDQRKMTLRIPVRDNSNIYPIKEKVQVRCKNGEFKWMELNARILENEFKKQSFAIFTFRDISETVELEKATARFAEELFSKYKQLKREKNQSLLSVI